MHALFPFSERLLAAQNPLSHADRPHQLFADAPPMMIPMMPPPPPPGAIAPMMHVPPPTSWFDKYEAN